jgi:hypothetical protein
MKNSKARIAAERILKKTGISKDARALATSVLNRPLSNSAALKTPTAWIKVETKMGRT